MDRETGQMHIRENL